MDITEVYAIQSVVNAEIKLHERTLAKQVKDANKNIQKMKLAIQETKQKMKEWEGNYHKIVKVVALSCKNFVAMGIT